LVARRAHNPKVVGSSPASATRKALMHSIRAFLWPYLKQATTKAQPQINAKALKLLLRFSDSVFQLNKRTLKNQQWVNNQPKGTIYFKYSQFTIGSQIQLHRHIFLIDGNLLEDRMLELAIIEPADINHIEA
jgi:hypothetical protein